MKPMIIKLVTVVTYTLSHRHRTPIIHQCGDIDGTCGGGGNFSIKSLYFDNPNLNSSSESSEFGCMILDLLFGISMKLFDSRVGDELVTWLAEAGLHIVVDDATVASFAPGPIASLEAAPILLPLILFLSSWLLLS